MKGEQMKKLLTLIGFILIALLFNMEIQKQLNLPLDHPHKMIIFKLIQQN